MTDPASTPKPETTTADDRFVDLPATAATLGGARRAGATSLPHELAGRFNLVEAWTDRGGQADLFLVETGGEKLVLKVLLPGSDLDRDVVEALLEDGSDLVARHHEVDRLDDGRWYQTLAYHREGTLRRLVGERWPDSRARTILGQLHGILGHLHDQLRLTHRDVKPDNLLIDSLDPLWLRITDFGIARAQATDIDFADRRMTTRYAPPETSLKVVGPFVDWWAVGMILVEGLTGRHPLADVADDMIPYTITNQGVDLSGVPEGWLPLCRGLLIRDHRRRWGAEDVRRWLAGEQLPIPTDTGSGVGHPFRIPVADVEREHGDRVSLAGTIAELPASSVDSRLVADIASWARWSLGEEPLAGSLTDLVHPPERDPEDLRTRVAVLLDPEQVPAFRGRLLSIPHGLLTVARAGIEGGRGTARMVSELYRDVLPFLAQYSTDSRYGEVQQSWSALFSEFRTASETVRQMGAPAVPPQTDQVALAQLLAVAVETVAYRKMARADLVSRAAAAGMTAGRRTRGNLADELATRRLRWAATRVSDAVLEIGWFRHLGDPSVATAGRLVAMLALGPLAEEQARRLSIGASMPEGDRRVLTAARAVADAEWESDRTVLLEQVAREVVAGSADKSTRLFERSLDAVLRDVDARFPRSSRIRRGRL